MLYRACVAVAVVCFATEAAAFSPVTAALSHAREMPAASRAPVVLMGRGDKRTTKGKRKAKSFGNARPRNGKLRRDRDGPGADLGVAKPAGVAPVFEAAAAPEPVPEPVVEEPVAAEEPAPVEEAAPAPAALSPKELMAAVKELRNELPQADLKECKAALEATGGDIAAAKEALIAEKGAEWEAAEAEAAAALKAATAAAMDLKDAQAAKKFDKQQAKAAEATEEPAPAAAEAAPEPVAEVAPAAAAAAPAADSAGSKTMLKPEACAAKAGLSVANAILLKPHALASKAGLPLL